MKKRSADETENKAICGDWRRNGENGSVVNAGFIKRVSGIIFFHRGERDT